jgi:hypothetical protein
VKYEFHGGISIRDLPGGKRRRIKGGGGKEEEE